MLRRSALPALAALALCLVVFRAARQSVTIDEAGSFLIFVTHAWPFPLYPGSGNHVLNSILQWLTMGAFGVSTLTLRTPAIIGAVIYVLSALWICRSLSRQM